jgi:hypothetical protein
LELLEQDDREATTRGGRGGRPEKATDIIRRLHDLEEGLVQGDVDCLALWQLNIPTVLIESEELTQDPLGVHIVDQSRERGREGGEREG